MRKTPHGNISITKYLSFEKFADLILRQHINFPRSDIFPDKRELFTVLDIWEAKKMKGLRDKSREERDRLWSEQEALEDRCENLRLKTFVNCWTKSISESYALWKIYLSGSPNGVAIKTTVAKLRKQIQKSEKNIEIKEVEYLDNSLDRDIKDEDIICTKSTPYKYENEVRFYTIKETKKEIKQKAGCLGDALYLAALNSEMAKSGERPDSYFRKKCLDFKIKPEAFIDHILISPFSTYSLRRTVSLLLKSHAPMLSDKIRSSQIIEK